MSRNGLKLHYDKLTPEERFRLDVLAMARGDKQESERLVSSCPKFTYTITDNAFSGRWLGALDITLRSYLWVAGYLDRLKTLEAIWEILPLQAGYARDRTRDAYVEGHRAGARQAWRGEGPASEWPLEGIDEAEGGPAGLSWRVDHARDP